MDSQVAKRFVSIDILRGFDMFWIVGGSGLRFSYFAHPLLYTGSNTMAQV